MRIVALAPSLAEFTESLGRGEHLVGVSESTRLKNPKFKPKSIGPFFRFSIEEVMSLAPTHVLATRDGNVKEQIDRLKELGAHVIVVRTSNLAEIESSWGQIAVALNSEPALEKLLSTYQAKKRSVQAKRIIKKKRILLQLGNDPLVVAGRGSFLQDALDLIGMSNVFAHSPMAYPRPSVEAVAKLDPDCMVIFSMGLSESKTWLKERVGAWTDRFPKLKAVREKCVLGFESGSLLKPVPEMMDDILRLQDLLSP